VKTYTESELRETLRVASLGATVETHTQSKRRVLAPILAAAAAAAIVIPIGLVRLGDDTNSSLRARDHASVRPLPRTPNHPTGDGQTGDEVTLQEITNLTGYEFKKPAPGDTPEITEEQAIAIADADYSLGAQLVGVERLSSSDPQGAVDTTWKLVWVVAQYPREVTEIPSRPSPASGPHNAWVSTVTLVDAANGMVFRTLVF
jgi:hypothetical protein